MSANRPANDLAPKSAKYIQFAVFGIIAAGLIWWLKPTSYYPVTADAIPGNWTLYDSGYDATGILELHPDGTYITRYEHTGPRDFQMKGLGQAGTWHLNGSAVSLDEIKGQGTHNYQATMTADKKKMKIQNQDENFYYVFTRR
jgi:hypothetical protein